MLISIGLPKTFGKIIYLTFPTINNSKMYDKIRIHFYPKVESRDCRKISGR